MTTKYSKHISQLETKNVLSIAVSPRMAIVGSWAFDDNIFLHISFITLRLTNILMLAPQEHFSAGVVELMLNAAPSVHEEHLEKGHLHSIRCHLHSSRYNFHSIKYHFHCIG